MTLSKHLKTAILAGVVAIVGAASIAPASAHELDRRDGYSRDRDDHRGGFDRRDHGRGDHGWRHRHFHRGWY